MEELLLGPPAHPPVGVALPVEVSPPGFHLRRDCCCHAHSSRYVRIYISHTCTCVRMCDVCHSVVLKSDLEYVVGFMLAMLVPSSLPSLPPFLPPSLPSLPPYFLPSLLPPLPPLLPCFLASFLFLTKGWPTLSWLSSIL